MINIAAGNFVIMEIKDVVMENRKSNSSKNNGLKFKSLLLASLFCSDSSAALQGNLYLQLYQAPSPPVLSMLNIPFQKGTANVDFSVNLKQFLYISKPEIKYLFKHGIYDPGAHFVIDSYRTTSGIPDGVTQIYNEPGDCSSIFTENPGFSCLAHFIVDPERFRRGAGWGPVINTTLTWQYSSIYSTTASVAVDQPYRFDDLLIPIIHPINITVSPETQDGLYFDTATSSIVGKPTRTGIYSFYISATDGNATAAPRELQIGINVNPMDKPQFKLVNNIASATPKKVYHLNLEELLEQNTSFGTSNQITFELSENHPHPKWLSLDKESHTILHGEARLKDAGKLVTATIYAISNTGGKSEPETIQIPVAYDLDNRPVINNNIELSSSAGGLIRNELRNSINDPTSDQNLKLFIDKVEPEAPWLKISSYSPTEIEGEVPNDAAGKTYLISLRANNTTGGSSDVVEVPLKIDINERRTPRFYGSHPRISRLYEGHSYVYDFVANNDVDPEYKDFPYAIELAKGYDNPGWVRIEANKLIIDEVPSDLISEQLIYITIKNIPGGRSKVQSLELFINS